MNEGWKTKQNNKIKWRQQQQQPKKWNRASEEEITQAFKPSPNKTFETPLSIVKRFARSRDTIQGKRAFGYGEIWRGPVGEGVANTQNSKWRYDRTTFQTHSEKLRSSTSSLSLSQSPGLTLCVAAAQHKTLFSQSINEKLPKGSNTEGSGLPRGGQGKAKKC